ncbi:hypothetical protein EST38_g14445 [Candolleomyces aberdarensis]|uniref:DUF6533 domain-containing protein n=1 Tax=Candolleomyces aberdarensis TaxID=2316362 RepID=A0A4Q2CX89_9AGAR|nr:hypothetical protein EST38_g14445 [Candolleomyces aberdarensis]
MSVDPTVLRRAQLARAEFGIQFSSITLIYYDYLLTFPDEIQYIWKNPKRLSTFFYFCCRYYLIANLLWMLTKVSNGTLPGLRFVSCNTVAKVSATCAVFGNIGVLSVWGLRTFAICNDNKAVKGAIATLGAAILISLIVRLPFARCSDLPAITKYVI